jgi:Putative transmembrane protein (PGPGW)
VKRTSSRTGTKKSSGGEVDRHQQSIPQQPKSSRRKVDLKRDPQDDNATHDQIALEQVELKRIKELPKEVGVMLITAGIVGLILPGPGTPALIAGGLALWPKAFDKLESWLQRHHPAVHRESMKQVDRFLNDLERRYPYSRYEPGKR